MDRDPIQRQIGRMLERNQRAAARYDIRTDEDPTLPSGLPLVCSARPEWEEWARYSEGCYVLRTNIEDWTAEDLWRTYIQLTEAEAAFSIQKTELSLRPVWHQKAERVEAHILVCFLAYVLWKTLEQWQRRARLGSSPRLLLDEMAAVQSTDVVLPLAKRTSSPIASTIRRTVPAMWPPAGPDSGRIKLLASHRAPCVRARFRTGTTCPPSKRP